MESNARWLTGSTERIIRERQCLSNSVSQLIATEDRNYNPLYFPGESIALWHIQRLWLEICESGEPSVEIFENLLADRDGFDNIVASGGHAVELPVPNSPNPSLSSSNSEGNGRCHPNPRRRPSVTSYRRAGPGVVVHEKFKCFMENMRNGSPASSGSGSSRQRTRPPSRKLSLHEKQRAAVYAAEFVEKLRWVMARVEDVTVDSILAPNHQRHVNQYELGIGAYE